MAELRKARGIVRWLLFISLLLLASPAGAEDAAPPALSAAPAPSAAAPPVAPGRVRVPIPADSGEARRPSPPEAGDAGASAQAPGERDAGSVPRPLATPERPATPPAASEPPADSPPVPTALPPDPLPRPPLVPAPPSAILPPPVAPAATLPPPVAPSALAPPSGPAASAAVRLADKTVFVLRAARTGKSAQERARLTSIALSTALDDPSATEVKVVRQGEVAVVYAGGIPLVQLGSEDAERAGDSSLDVHAGAVAAAIRQALDTERQRSRVARNVISVALAVLLALIAFYLVRKVGEVSERVADWLHANGDRVLAVRVHQVEIVRPATLKNSGLVGLGIAKWLGQFGILYAWLVIVLSMFETTRGYTEQLTGLVVAPLSELMGRLARALPMLVVALIAVLAVAVLVRFVGLFFESVAREETTLDWLPSDLAAPTSVLLRISIVILALIFAAPVVTGDADGAFGRAGMVALGALGLSGTPLLASALMGSILLFGRRLRVGEHAEINGVVGRITSINLLELRLLMPDLTELRIPHLMLLLRPLRGLGAMPRISVEIAVSSGVTPATVQPLLEEAGGRVGRDVRSDVLAADADGVLYRVSATCDSIEQRAAFTTSLLEALSKAGVPLGRTQMVPRRP